MTGTLTQEEINALLSVAPGSGLSGIGERPAQASVGAKHIRTYNFRHPVKLSKSHLSTLGLIYGDFLHHLEVVFLTYVRQNINVSIASLEQQSFEEYKESLSSSSFLAIFTMKNLPGSAVLEISPELTFLILDRLLGGANDQPIEVRDLTKIEHGIMGKVVERVLTALKKAWPEAYNADPSVETLGTNSELQQVIPPDEIVAVTTLEVRMGMANGTMSICLPHFMLEPIMSELAGRAWLSTTEYKDSGKSKGYKVERALNQVSLPVSVELGRTKVSVKDLLQLKPGDPVRLDMPADHDIKVLINGKVKFYAHLGVDGKKLAVKITEAAD